MNKKHLVLLIVLLVQLGFNIQPARASDSTDEKGNTSPEANRLVTRITTRPALEFYDLKKDPYELEVTAGKYR